MRFFLTLTSSTELKHEALNRTFPGLPQALDAAELVAMDFARSAKAITIKVTDAAGVVLATVPAAALHEIALSNRV